MKNPAPRHYPARRGVNLAPREGNHAVEIDEDNQKGQHILAEGLEPAAEFRPLAGIGLGEEVVPAPAPAVAAEEHHTQRAQRQEVVGHQEVPQIQPGTGRDDAFALRL